MYGRPIFYITAHPCGFLQVCNFHRPNRDIPLSAKVRYLKSHDREFIFQGQYKASYVAFIANTVYILGVAFNFWLPSRTVHLVPLSDLQRLKTTWPWN